MWRAFMAVRLLPADEQFLRLQRALPNIDDRCLIDEVAETYYHQVKGCVLADMGTDDQDGHGTGGLGRAIV